MKIIGKTIMGSALGLALATNGLAQTNLQFTAATQTDEQAIRLTWASTNYEVYQIQCANALATNADGSTAWQILYDDYPSQGTNTFWLDTGNYNLVPAILHPKNMPMRFYRILDKGPDGLAYDEPTVSIVTPTNGFFASGSLTIAVAAGTDQATLNTKLYVDGQEMWPSEDGSNYVINTCEWGNGAHTLFATAEASSAPSGGPVNSPAALVGHAVSPFIQVTFSNLITRISFSEPFFNPDAGQTQQVTAVFAANSDWTLNIVDASSNVVKTATGSGISMLYNWDGSDSSNQPVLAGVYHYYISAQTNGESSDIVIGGSSGGSGGSVPSPSFARSSAVSSDSSSSMELWAVPTDLSGGVVPLALYPPGVDTNGLTIFAASPAEIQSLRPPVSRAKSFVAMNGSSGGFSPADSGGGGYSGSSAQDAPAAPGRPSTAPMARVAGTFGIAYQTYSAVGTGYYQPSSPSTYNNPTLGRITIEGHGSGDPPKYYALRKADTEALLFGAEMGNGGWSISLTKPDDKLQIGDLRGSGTPFNQVNLGYLIIHGATGDTMDFTAGGCKQMYFPIASGTGAQYLRMSEMNFGGSGTNGLKWMVINACRSLNHVNWSSMQNQNIKPYNGDLHLLLGADTDDFVEPIRGQNFAKYILHGTNGSPMTIKDAWYQAGQDAYQSYTSFPSGQSSIVFAVAGDNACLNDTVKTNYTPSGGTWFYNSKQVWHQ